MLRYRYRITYFDICGARAIYPRFATVLLRSLLCFISILIQPTLCQNISLYEPEQSLSLSQDEGEQC